MQNRIRFLVLFVTNFVPVAGHADTCAAVAILAQIHDSYIALFDVEERTRTDAAIALLALHLPEVDPARLDDELGDAFDFDTGRLQRILRDTLAAARTVAAKGNATLPAEHAADTDWLADIVWDSGCEEAWGSDGPARRPTPPPPSPLNQPLNLALGLILLIAGTVGAVFGARALRRSRVVRRQELRRQPRKPVSLAAIAALPNGESRDVRVLDISLGGMRITLEEAPPQSSPLTLEIAEKRYAGTIAWKNDFYAGILLDIPLTDEGLRDLLELNITAPAGKAAPTSN